MNYKDIIIDMLKPEDKLGSVIDTFLTIGEILEEREKVTKGQYFDADSFDKVILRTMYVLGFYPFYNAHGSVMRPLLIQALKSKNPIETFFIEAIPTALTIAMPQKQEEYFNYRDTVKTKFES